MAIAKENRLGEVVALLSAIFLLKIAYSQVFIQSLHVKKSQKNAAKMERIAILYPLVGKSFPL
jgi:hypothetical protein